MTALYSLLLWELVVQWSGLGNALLRRHWVGSDDSLEPVECTGIHHGTLIPGEAMKKHPVLCSLFYIPVIFHEENYLPV